MVKFFHIICKSLFVFFLAASKVERRLLGSISKYFVTVETNRREMPHLHCSLWLKKASYLATRYVLKFKTTINFVKSCSHFLGML